MAIHFSILSWRLPRTEEPSGLLHRFAESDTPNQLSMHKNQESVPKIVNILKNKQTLGTWASGADTPERERGCAEDGGWRTESDQKG